MSCSSAARRAVFGARAQLVGDHRRQARDLDRVAQHVLAVARAELQPAEQLHQLGVHRVHVRLEQRLLALLHHVVVDLGLGLVVGLLDARRVDAAVLDELLERQLRDLAPHRVERGQHDRRGRLVDDEVDARDVLERADVAALAADDAALHVVGGQRHERHGRLRRVAGGQPLHARGEDVARAPRRPRGAPPPRPGARCAPSRGGPPPRPRAAAPPGLRAGQPRRRARARARACSAASRGPASRCSSSREALATGALASRPGRRSAPRATPRAGGCAPPCAAISSRRSRSASSGSPSRRVRRLASRRSGARRPRRRPPAAGAARRVVSTTDPAGCVCVLPRTAHAATAATQATAITIKASMAFSPRPGAAPPIRRPGQQVSRGAPGPRRSRVGCFLRFRSLIMNKAERQPGFCET